MWNLVQMVVARAFLGKAFNVIKWAYAIVVGFSVMFCGHGEWSACTRELAGDGCKASFISRWYNGIAVPMSQNQLSLE